MKRFLLIAAVTATSICTSAHADPLIYLNGTLDNGGTFSGSLNLIPQSTTFNGGTLTVQDAGSTSVVVSMPYVSQTIGAGTQAVFDEFGSGPAGGLQLFVLWLTAASLVADSPVPCTVAVCGSVELSYFTPSFLTNTAFYTTSINISTTPPTVTPEPSSLLLLGTGALSLAATARRHIRRA